MTNKMLTSETNVVNVREEDRAFIRNLKSLSPEKKMLVKGILIGMDLQEKPETAAARQLQAMRIQKGGKKNGRIQQ